MNTDGPTRPERPRWISALRTIGGVVLGLGGAVLVARLMGIHLTDLMTSLRRARLWPLLAAAGGTFVLLALQALRWWWVVRPVLPLRFREAFSAMLVASAFNVLIPARGGDVIRVQYLGKRTATSRVTLLGTELLDYWSDKAGWLLAFVITSLVSLLGWREGPPRWLLHAMGALAVLVLGAAALALVAHLPLLRRLSPRVDPGPQWLQKLRSGFAAHDRRSLGLVIGVLAPFPWLWEVPVVMVAARAVDLSPSPMLAFAVLTAANLGTVLPVPGGAGSFEAAGAFALAAAGVRHSRAFAFVMLYHLSLLLPIVVAGVGLLVLQGKSLVPRRLAERLRRTRRPGALEPGRQRP
ncbi:MAG TPA: lysylphosphatidylglycerol synthase transmembrane domain-containing protein [Myxococcaceae bacterium]|nr:lysylphosphatidylglycerol synthase transmembrane domain-containing protein [Myxococcaceae bacterium]